MKLFNNFFRKARPEQNEVEITSANNDMDLATMLNSLAESVKKDAEAEFKDKNKFAAVLVSFDLGNMHYTIRSASEDEMHCRFAEAIKEHIIQYGSFKGIIHNLHAMQFASGSFSSYAENENSTVISLK